jgi:hypothetical protein
MITVACVYKTAPNNGLSPEYVRRLEANVREHTTRPFKFVCLTDVPDEVECASIKLDDNLPRQLSKIELFKPHLSGRIVYFDIDTIIVRNIDKLMDYDGRFAMLHCWRQSHHWASGIMAWDGPVPCILPTPNERRLIDKGPERGDQLFISNKLVKAGYTIDRVRDIVNAVSYRWHVVHKFHHVGEPECAETWKRRPDSHRGLPDDADIVCFHGGPRPHEIGWKL